MGITVDYVVGPRTCASRAYAATQGRALRVVLRIATTTPHHSMASGSVGIDIGTLSSCVAIFKNDQPDVIANENGILMSIGIVQLIERERVKRDARHNQRGYKKKIITLNRKQNNSLCGCLLANW